MFVEIVSPSGRVFSGEATGVRAPGVEGSFEVLRNHAPMIAAISIGSLVVTDKAGTPITFATSGGFVEVSNNVVTVLAETAELASKIDVERAAAAEQRAVEALALAMDPETKARMSKALDRARNRARVAMASVGHKR
jgi:F-type H+-transporting ATPase subunit epsilon